MKIIIIGVGKVGETLVKDLVRENHDIIVVDTNSVAVNGVVNRYDVMGIIGSGVEREVMLNAGVDTADIFIACTSRDELNILSCVLAKKLGAKSTVARVRDPQLFNEMSNIRRELGLDMAFNPELKTASEIVDVLKFPSAKNVESFADGRATMIEFVISKDNPLIGKSLIEIASFGFKILFAMVERDGKTIIPKGDFTIQQDDTVHIIATEQEITAFCKKLKIFKPHSKSVFIVGGSKVCYYLSKELCAKGIEVKIIEQSRERCEQLSQTLPKASIICADATDQNILDEENLKGFDACVTLTGTDESNVILSLYAMQREVDKVITKIDRKNVNEMVKTLGLGTIVSPKDVISNHILRFVRSRQTSSLNEVKTLYRLNECAEAIEFTIDASFELCGVPLKELKFKSNVLIGGIVRGDDFILPVGSTVLLPEDRVIVVSNLKKINEFVEIFD